MMDTKFKISADKRQAWSGLTGDLPASNTTGIEGAIYWTPFVELEDLFDTRLQSNANTTTKATLKTELLVLQNEDFDVLGFLFAIIDTSISDYNSVH